MRSLQEAWRWFTGGGGAPACEIARLLTTCRGAVAWTRHDGDIHENPSRRSDWRAAERECGLHIEAVEPMLLASVVFRVQPHKRGEVLSAVDEAVERMRRTAGCARCRLLVDTEDPNVFTLASEWEAAAEADAFFESREFQIFKSIRILLREEPVVTMDQIRSRATRLIRSR